MIRVKLLLLCLCGMGMCVACKKDYTCHCKTTVVDSRPPSTIKTSDSAQPLGEKMTDDQASGACTAIKNQLQDNFLQQLTAVPEVTVFVSCNVY